MEIDNEKLYTIDEIVQLFGTSKSSVYRAIDRGELAAFKPFGAWRVTGEALAAYVASVQADIINAQRQKHFTKLTGQPETVEAEAKWGGLDGGETN